MIEEGEKSRTTVTIPEAQAMLPDLIHPLTPGEEVVITENNAPVAKLVSTKPAVHQRPQLGLCNEMLTIVAEDDKHRKVFAEYMP